MIVIGNGESRSTLNFSRVKDLTIGCNAIVRDFVVDHVVCVDRKMVKECIEHHQKNFTTLYTRPDWIKSYTSHKIFTVPKLLDSSKERWDDPFHWGSGPYAVLLAAKLADKVDMIGFDLWSDNKFVNNCYKDTDNYDASNKRAVDPRYWIHQIGRVFEWFPQTEFTVYQTPNWQSPEKWNRTNVHVDKISNFTYTKHCGL